MFVFKPMQVKLCWCKRVKQHLSSFIWKAPHHGKVISGNFPLLRYQSQPPRWVSGMAARKTLRNNFMMSCPPQTLRYHPELMADQRRNGLWKRQISLRDGSHGSLFVESVFKNSLSGFRTGVCGSGGAGRPISSSGPQERALRIDGRRVWRTRCRPPAWPRAPFAVKIKTEQQKH